VSLETIFARAEKARLVCVGEEHDDAEHHRFQHRVLVELAQRAAARKTVLGLGLEMLARPYQPVLDDYARGAIDSHALRSQSEWDARWGFAFGMYQPLFESARRHRVALLALNAPRTWTKQVAREGLDALPEELRSELPELKLDDHEHRRFFWAVMGFDAHQGEHGAHGPHDGGDGGHHAHGHGHAAASAERYYAAQVVWDETMAETAASWLGRAESRQLIVVAGNGHCHESAVVRRVRRRLGEVPTVSLLLYSHDDEPAAHAASDYVIRFAALR
jgi:uncharacterized iron-regulated protein